MKVTLTNVYLKKIWYNTLYSRNNIEYYNVEDKYSLFI